MEKYHKIQTVFKRDPKTNFKTLLNEFSLPEFELLKNIQWVFTEKIDGTNIRIIFDGEKVRFGGKTDNAQIPIFLLNVLQDKFTVEMFKNEFPDSDNVCLYGEGYGAKIQKGGNYLSDRTNFILFDCRIGEWWLTREICEQIANDLNIDIVPVIGHGTLLDAVEIVKKGFKSTIAENKNYDAEGLVMKPALELFCRNGNRVISKIKHKDFPNIEILKK